MDFSFRFYTIQSDGEKEIYHSWTVFILLSFLPVEARISERSSAVSTSSRANINERGEFEQNNEWFYRTKVRRSSASLHSAKDDREKERPKMTRK